MVSNKTGLPLPDVTADDPGGFGLGLGRFYRKGTWRGLLGSTRAKPSASERSSPIGRSSISSPPERSTAGRRTARTSSFPP